jgi:F0F1-type ATP synthase assembly protein I
MAKQGRSPAVRFVIALLVVLAVAFVAFFVGYLIGTRLAGIVPADAVPSLFGIL